MTQNDERHFCISIAGRAVAIETLYTNTYAMCKDYICDQQPEVRVRIDEGDMALERSEATGSKRDGYLETLAVYRKISEAMLDFDTFLMHGAVVAQGNAAYMFTAVSGTGKTTHVRKWLQNLPDARIVNGDKPLVRITDTQAIACGTPWCGKERLGENIMVPLKAIVLMERAEDNAIAEISYGKAFTFLLQQTYRPADAEKLKKTLVLVSKLKGRVRFFRFSFNNMKEDAFSVAHSALTRL